MPLLLLAGSNLISSAVPAPSGVHALQPTEAHGSTSRSPLNFTALFNMMLDKGYFDIMPSHGYRELTSQPEGALTSDNSVSDQAHHVLNASSAANPNPQPSVANLTAPALHAPTGNLQYGDRKLVADDEWLQVMRFGSKCRATIEGYSAGFPTDCGSDYDKMNRSDLSSCNKAHPPAKVGYGCWFYFAQPELQRHFYGEDFWVKRSSGVSVNVGTSLRVDSRASASAALGLPCANPPLCNKASTAQDKLYCERAVEQGYDSIQFARPHLPCLREECLYNSGPGWVSELLLCTGSCMTKPLVDACPPDVEMRTAEGEPCPCSNKGHTLNCGKGSKLYGRPDEGNQTCSHLTSPELGELYVNNFADGNFLIQSRELQQTIIKNMLTKEGRSFALWYNHSQLAIADYKNYQNQEKAYYALAALAKAITSNKLDHRKPIPASKLEKVYQDGAKMSRKAIKEAMAAAYEASAADLGIDQGGGSDQNGVGSSGSQEAGGGGDGDVGGGGGGGDDRS